MTVDVEQFNTNIAWINEKLEEHYPGAVLIWSNPEGPTELTIPEELLDQMADVASYVEDLVRQCGGEATFHLDEAYEVP